MDSYCVIGNPVQHSRSPWIHARFAALTGQALRYEHRLAPLDGFAASVAAFRTQAQAQGARAAGCNVTIPFKFEAAALAHGLSERAQLAQAVNTLRFDPDGRLYGDNTDGVGLRKDIEDHAGVPLLGRTVLLIGAGGAAAGVLGPLLQAQPRRLMVANRSADKAAALAQRHQALSTHLGVRLESGPLPLAGGPYDVVVNATAASLAAQACPVSADVLRPGTLAVDLMYGPPAAGFMEWARAHGARARDGLGMLVEQAAEAFALWRGIRPPTVPVLAELRALLAG